jgi:hypothetical protein
VLAQPLADEVVGPAEKVLADVSEEMKMADEVRDPRKDLGHGFENSRAHVVHQRQRNAEVRLEALQEGDDLPLILRRQLDIAQHDFRKRIEAAH